MLSVYLFEGLIKEEVANNVFCIYLFISALLKSIVFDPEVATDPYFLEENIQYALSSGQTFQIITTGQSGFYDDYEPFPDYQAVTTHDGTDDEEGSHRDRVGELVG